MQAVSCGTASSPDRIWAFRFGVPPLMERDEPPVGRSICLLRIERLLSLGSQPSSSS